jgi:hypothetical protein
LLYSIFLLVIIFLLIISISTLSLNPVLQKKRIGGVPA